MGFFGSAKKPKTLDVYLAEDGPYKGTVVEVIYPFLGTISRDYAAFAHIDTVLDNDKSELYIELDSKDKRVKSCLLSAYLSLVDYNKNIEDEREIALINTLNQILEENFPKKPTEMLSGITEMLNEIRTTLKDWLDSNPSGNSETVFCALVSTYLALRCLTIKISSSKVIQMMVSSDVVESLKSAMLVIKDGYKNYLKTREQQEQQALRARHEAEQHEPIAKQIEDIYIRLNSRLETTKATILNRHTEMVQEFDGFIPLLKIFSDYQNDDEFIEGLKTIFPKKSDLDAMVKLLRFSTEERAAVQGRLFPDNSMRGYASYFWQSSVELLDMLTGNLTLFDPDPFMIFRDNLKAYFRRRFPEALLKGEFTSRRMIQSIKEFRNNLPKEALSVSSHQEKLVVIKDKRLAINAILTKLTSPLPLVTSQDIDDSYTDKELMIRILKDTKNELDKAEQAIKERAPLFLQWNELWEQYKVLKSELLETEQKELDAIESRLVDPLLDAIYDGEKPTDFTQKLTLCTQVYHKAEKDLAKQVLDTDKLIKRVKQETASEIITEVRTYLHKREKRLIHKILCRVSKTYKALFEAITQEIPRPSSASNGQPVSDEQRLSLLNQKIEEKMKEASWFTKKVIKRSACGLLTTVSQSKLVFFIDSKKEDRSIEADSSNRCLDLSVAETI